MASISTTSYAILGLLSLRSWTTYELADQMKRALGQFWPRAESGIYTEPQKLVDAGFATVTEEFVGKRARKRYAITNSGREALRQWVPTSSTPPSIEFEALIKIFYAERGTKTDLLRTLHAIREENEDRSAAGQGIPHEYLERRAGYPERLAWNLLIGQFIDEFEQMLDRWSAWAIAEVEQWPDDIAKAEPAWAVLQAQADHADAFVARVAERKRASAEADARS